MSCAAYLRLYVPWDGRPLLQAVTPGRPGSRVLVNGEFGLWYESSRNDAFVVDWEGRRFICPRYPRLRMLEGLLALHHAYRSPVGPVLVPQSVADRAADELGHLQAALPGARSHILTSPFYVPLRWFAAFDPGERKLVQGREGPGICYWTGRDAAALRLERAVHIIEEAGFDEGTVEEARSLITWMSPFPADSLLELDYGGVAALFSEGDLAADESAAEVGASLEALARGDFEEAGDLYAAAASRWAHAQSLTYAN